jgi:hypothetical protein
MSYVTCITIIDIIILYIHTYTHTTPIYSIQVYVGVVDSKQSQSMQDAVEEARYYMANNALYIQRQEMGSRANKAHTHTHSRPNTNDTYDSNRYIIHHTSYIVYHTSYINTYTHT